jgi:carbon storage regulator
MLVLTRRPNESIIIANNIKITVVSVGPGRVKLGIEAPPHVRVDRQEIHEKIEQSTDVLTALAGGEVAADIQNDAQNTVIVNGPDTATIVTVPTTAGTGTATGTEVAPAPAVPTAPLGQGAAQSGAPEGKLNKFRFPRKPR